MALIAAPSTERSSEHNQQSQLLPTSNVETVHGTKYGTRPQCEFLSQHPRHPADHVLAAATDRPTPSRPGGPLAAIEIPDHDPAAEPIPYDARTSDARIAPTGRQSEAARTSTAPPVPESTGTATRLVRGDPTATPIAETIPIDARTSYARIAPTGRQSEAARIATAPPVLASTGTATRLVRGDPNSLTFSFDGAINGRSVDILVDSGAYFSFLSEDFYREHLAATRQHLLQWWRPRWTGSRSSCTSTVRPSVSQLRLKEREWSGPGDFRELYTQSLKPAIEKMEERVQHARWADRHFQTYPAAEDAAIKAVTDGIKGILDLFKDVDTNRLDSIKRSLDKLESVDVKDLENLGGDFAVFLALHAIPRLA